MNIENYHKNRKDFYLGNDFISDTIDSVQDFASGVKNVAEKVMKDFKSVTITGNEGNFNISSKGVNYTTNQAVVTSADKPEVKKIDYLKYLPIAAPFVLFFLRK